ncbi:MAG: hypothetical protein MMC33_000408 [Icmadophila ericetorum]|nr:hypothetical protein [Icmadophila ericetorum]
MDSTYDRRKQKDANTSDRPVVIMDDSPKAHATYDASANMLHILEKSIDDIRGLVTCRICVREMTQLFVSRAELMASGETTDEHRTSQEEESGIVERDKLNNDPRLGGLFRGCFKERTTRFEGPIRDHEDGVERCPRCAWELEDGYCSHCGVIYGSDGEEAYSVDGDWSDEEDISDEDISHDGFDEGIDEDLDEDIPNFVDDGNHSSLAGDDLGDDRSRYSEMGHFYESVDHYSPQYSPHYSPSPVPGDEEDAIIRAIEGYESTVSGGDGTTDLNNGYDSDDDDEGDRSEHSSFYGDSEITAQGELGYVSDPDDEDRQDYSSYRFSPVESDNEDANSQTSSRSRSIAPRVSEDANSVTSKSRSPSRELDLPVQRYTGTARVNGKQREPAATGSSISPVYKVDSDSEPPVTTQRSRKRRLVVEDDSSEDCDDSDAENCRPRKRKSSSGSATIGPNSPQIHNSMGRSDQASRSSTPERESSKPVPQPFLTSIASYRTSSNRLDSNIGPSTGRRVMSNRLLEAPPRTDRGRFGGGGGPEYGESSSRPQQQHQVNHLFSRSRPTAQDFFDW